MCTVTVVRLNQDSAGPIRLACNRDELRTRPAALPPEIRRCGDREAIMPIDSVSGGTWIGVNDAGLAATLLNVNPGHEDGVRRTTPMRSRGPLVPQLMSCAHFDDAARLAAEVDLRAYPPFRLVLMDRTNIADFHSDGHSLRQSRARLEDAPLMFTSSGLGDALVEGPRRELFNAMFASADAAAVQQYAFHRHSWPDRRHFSVCMERTEARTVSHTVIDIASDHVMLTYVPGAPDRAAPLPPMSLPIGGRIA